MKWYFIQQGDDDASSIKLSPTELIRCLERQPTFYGPDSPFHCIFGLPSDNKKKTVREEISKRIDTSFVDKLFINFCLPENLSLRAVYPKQYAQQRDSKIVHKSTIFPFDKNFSLRIKKGDKNFPEATTLKDKFYKYEDDQLQKWVSARQQLEDCPPFDWPSRKQDLSSKKYQHLLQEYAKYIKAPSNSLGLAELGLLAIEKKLKIHVYTNREDGKYESDDNQHLPRIKYQCTLNDDDPITRQEHFILYEDDGAWQPLKVRDKMRQFLQQRALQTAKWKYNQPAGSKLDIT